MTREAPIHIRHGGRVLLMADKHELDMAVEHGIHDVDVLLPGNSNGYSTPSFSRQRTKSSAAFMVFSCARRCSAYVHSIPARTGHDGTCRIKTREKCGRFHRSMERGGGSLIDHFSARGCVEPEYPGNGMPNLLPSPIADAPPYGSRRRVGMSDSRLPACRTTSRCGR